MKRNWIRRIIKGLSLTSALFVFQACYGTPHDFGLDLFIEGQVKSKTTDLPIEGIKVSVPGKMQYELTDNKGHFSFYTELMNNVLVRFEDIDAAQNGVFAKKDTILTIQSGKVFLDIKLEGN
jgi:hypothetical protein